MEPESRLWLFSLSIVLMPAGLILWGVGAAHGIHWFGLVFAMGLIAITNGLGVQISLSYCIDCYRELSGEAVVTVILIRNTMSFAIGYGLCKVQKKDPSEGIPMLHRASRAREAAKISPVRSAASVPDETIIAPQASKPSKVSSPDAMDTTGETMEPDNGDLSDQGELAGSEAEPDEDFVQKLGQKGSDFARAIRGAQGSDRGGSPLVADVSTWYEVFVLALEGLNEVEAQKEARQAGKCRFRSQKLAIQRSKEAADPQRLNEQLRERARRLADRIIFLAQVFGTDGAQDIEKLTSKLRKRFSASRPIPAMTQSIEAAPEAASRTAARFVSEWWMGGNLRARGNEYRFDRYIRETTLYRLHESLIREYEDADTDTNRMMVKMGLETATGVDVRTLCTAYLLNLLYGFPIEETRIKLRDKDKITDEIKQARNTIHRTLYMGQLYLAWEDAFGPGAFLLLSDKGLPT
ncbi:MAG: hypothetical protein OHK93_006000 [Ramalina farinacea]|uniref:Uncharacterized protein n=1 Tax=Ramalina farinacea TaxID=258253 RepID=A0AA43QJZ9_9LECA|nr:hypothetical protein [Ramalina farinacea]